MVLLTLIQWILKRAIEDFNKAIDLNPEDAGAYNNRGLAYGKTGNFHAAIQDFNTAIDLNPEDALFHSGRGVAYFWTGNFHAAIEDYSRAIDLNPEDAGVYKDRLGDASSSSDRRF